MLRSSCRRNEAAFGGEAVVKLAFAFYSVKRRVQVYERFALERSLVPSAAATGICIKHKIFIS